MTKAATNTSPAFWRGRETEDPTLPAILEFQWPSTAVVNAPMPRAAQGIIWMIASFVLVTIVAMALIPVDQVVTARGVVVAQSPTVLVQPLETAIVRSIAVREGQEVRAGEVLARLDPTFAVADFAALEAQVLSLDAEAARLKAESQDKPFIYEGADANWSLQLAIYGHRKAGFQAKTENYAHRIDQLASVVERSQSDASAYRERLGFAQSIEDMRKELESKQVGSRLSTIISMDSRVEIERALANAVKTVEGATRDRDALISERDSFIRGWQAQTSQSLFEVTGKLSDARELLNKAKLRRQLVELRTETNAIVQSVAKVSVGSVLQSGQQLITLVPTNAPLEIEANISGRDNGFVHLDDPVSIKFDTFPYSQYGTAEGFVRIVSPDSFTAQSEERNPTSNAPVPTTTEVFYRARLTLDRVALHDVPTGFRIIPGMPVTADIKVGQRTVLQYLLGSMLPVAKEGMREP